MDKDKLNTKQYQSFPITVKKVNKEAGTLEAIFSTEDKDRHGDVVMQDGWILDAFRNNPVILNSHNYNDAEEVVGKASNVRVEDGKLQGTITFAVDENPKAKVIFDLYAGKYLNTFSVGFIPRKFKEDEEGNKDFSIIEEAELLEVSAVAVPANAFARAKKKGINVDALEEEKKVAKKELDGGVVCMDCNADISDEEKQKQRHVEENIYELVCEECLNKDEDEEEVEETTEPDEEETQEDEVEETDTDEEETEEEPEEQEPEKSYNEKVLDALNSIERKEVKKLKRTRAIIDSLIEEKTTHQYKSKETREKIRKRKVNKVIRAMFDMKN